MIPSMIPGVSAIVPSYNWNWQAAYPPNEPCEEEVKSAPPSPSPVRLPVQDCVLAGPVPGEATARQDRTGTFERGRNRFTYWVDPSTTFSATFYPVGRQGATACAVRRYPGDGGHYTPVPGVPSALPVPAPTDKDDEKTPTAAMAQLTLDNCLRFRAPPVPTMFETLDNDCRWMVFSFLRLETVMALREVSEWEPLISRSYEVTHIDQVLARVTPTVKKGKTTTYAWFDRCRATKMTEQVYAQKLHACLQRFVDFIKELFHVKTMWVEGDEDMNFVMTDNPDSTFPLRHAKKTEAEITRLLVCLYRLLLQRLVLDNQLFRANHCRFEYVRDCSMLDAYGRPQYGPLTRNPWARMVVERYFIKRALLMCLSETDLNVRLDTPNGFGYRVLPIPIRLRSHILWRMQPDYNWGWLTVRELPLVWVDDLAWMNTLAMMHRQGEN